MTDVSLKDWPMKPMMVVPPGEISEADIQMLRDNGICVVVANNPAVVKFVDPIPAVVGRNSVEQAAISLSRKVLSHGVWSSDYTRKIIAGWFVDLLVQGTSLDPHPTQQEMEKRAYNQERIDESKRIAREEMRAERAAKKSATTKK